MDLPIAVIARSVTKPRQCDRSPRHCDRSPRQCDRSPRHCEGSPRHCERSEAIQAYKPGLLRCARNDGGCARNDGDYPRNDGDLSSLLVPINNRAQALYIKESRLK